MKLILWSNVVQIFLDFVKLSNFYAPSKYVQMPPFWFTTEFSGVWSRAGCDVKSRTQWFCSSLIYLYYICGKGWESSSKNCQPGALKRGRSDSRNLQEVLGTLHFIPILFTDGRLEAKKRRKRWVDFVKVKHAKLKCVSRLGVRGSVQRISNQMISFDAWIFRKRKGFCWLHGSSKMNLVKTAFLSIHAAIVGSNLRNSSQSAQPTETEGRRIVRSHVWPS